jgi:predicted lipoprotein with Yx(FWY)xxD motif
MIGSAFVRLAVRRGAQKPPRQLTIGTIAPNRDVLYRTSPAKEQAYIRTRIRQSGQPIQKQEVALRSRISLIVALLAITIGSAAAAVPEAVREAYPKGVALEHEAGVWTYRQATSTLRLYVSDLDAPGRSSCKMECISIWPPLIAASGEKALGHWTLIARDRGKQWVYKGRPVYLHVHDTPQEPQGDGVDGKWHFLKP